MNKYDVVPCGQGYLAITASKWKRESGNINTIDPFTLKEGMHVVDCFNNCVTIKEVIPPKNRIPGKTPQYCYIVDNGNTHPYWEISGELLAVISEENFKNFIRQNEIIDVL